MADDITLILRVQDLATSEIKSLQSAIQNLKNQQVKIQSSAFNAFSRAQIQPQIEALRELQQHAERFLNLTQAKSFGGNNSLLDSQIRQQERLEALIKRGEDADQRAAARKQANAEKVANALAAKEERAARQQAAIAIRLEERAAQQEQRKAIAAEKAAERSAAAAERAARREAEAVGNAAIRGATERENAQRIYDAEGEKQEKMRSESFAAMQRWTDRQTAEREKAAQKGFEAADREMQREKVARRRQIEEIGNAQIKAAFEREKAEQRIYAQALKDNETFHRQRFGIRIASEGDSDFGRVSPSALHALRNFEQEHRKFASQLEASKATAGSFWRLNRQGALEAQAAVVNTVQALASGMNPMHVAIMESTQLGGAAIQGGAISLQQLVTALTSPLGILAVAATGAATAVAFLGYRALESRNHIDSIQGSLLTTGNAANLSSSQIEHWNSSLVKLGASRAEAMELTAAFGPLYAIVGENAKAFSEFAQIQAQVSGGNLENEINAWSNAIKGGAEGLVKLAEARRIGTEKQRQDILGDARSGNVEKAISDLARITEEANKQSRTLAEGQRAWRDFWFTMGASALGAPFPGGAVLFPQIQAFLRDTQTRFFIPNQPQRPSDLDLSKAVKAESEDQAQLARIVEERLKYEREITTLIQQRQNLLNSLRSTQSPEDLARTSQAIIEIERQLRTTRTPGEADRHAKEMAQLESRKQIAEQAARHDRSKQQEVLAIHKQTLDTITAYEQSEAAKRAGIADRLMAAKIQALQRYTAEEFKTQRSLLEGELAEIDKERAQNPADLAAQQLAAERQLAALRKNQTGDIREIEAKEIEIIRLNQAQVLQGENLNILQLKEAEAIAQSRGELDKVVELRRREFAIVQASKLRSPVEKANFGLQVTQGEIQSFQKAIQLQQQIVENANRNASQRFDTTRSYLALEAELGNTTKEQAIQAEMTLTQQVLGQQRQRLMALIETGTLTKDQEARTTNQIGDLWEQSAQKQIELQRQLTQEISQENERRLENFRQFFDTVGTSASDLLIAGLTKSKTRNEALLDFGRSILTSFVHGAADMASKFAGKGLASLLNVSLKSDEDSSIGNVISKALGNFLGLTKDEPKSEILQIKDQLDKAALAHEKAAGLLSESAAKLMESAGNLGQKRPGEPIDLRARVIEPQNQTVVGGRFDSAGLNTNTSALDRLTNVLNQATAVLPEGYSVRATSTVRENSSLLGSKHRTGEAIDVQIIDANGSPIKNRGEDTSGLYERLAIAGFRINETQFPGTNFTWGGRFGVRPGSMEADLMHFDAGMDRGRLRAPLSEISANYGPLPIDSAAITQAVANGQQQVVGDFRAAVEQGTIQGQNRNLQITQQDIQQTQNNSQASSENSTAIRDLTQTLQQKNLGNSGSSKGEGISPNLGSSGSEQTTNGGMSFGRSFSMLSQGLGLAASAAALFGNNLSTTGRIVLGTLGLIGNAIPFISNLSSVFGTASTVVQGTTTATSLLQTANTVNTTATAANTIATQINSSAQAAGAAGSGIGSIFKMIPFVGMFFEHGGIVPSAAGGMIMSGNGFGSDGGQISILHPREMVLPANISDGLQNLIAMGTQSGGNLSNVSNTANLEYKPTYNGYHPYNSRRSIDSLMRRHGGDMMRWAESAMRNGLYPVR